MTALDRIKDKFTPFQIIILGFACVVIIGAFFLMLPISSQTHEATSLRKALFTATSAVCVTGLVVEDTVTYWSHFGQAIILLLIQIGGLGVISVVSIFVMLSGKKIGLMQRQTMQNAISAPQLGGIVKLTRFIFIGTFLVEAIGAVLLLPVFCKWYGLEGIWMSFFHSISAFCNAGFDLMGGKSGKYSSLTIFADNPYLTTVICLLIVVGGIGFITWNDIATKKFRFKEYRMQSKVILATTFILIVIPTLIFFFVDFAEEPVKTRICKAIFQAVTPRTAGFNTADLSQMTEAGRSIMMMLMLIGGSPGSTAGGMKTTTAAILFANAIATIRKKKNANYFGRRIEDSIVKDASTILFIYIFLATVSAIVISLIEGLPMHDCMFETFSAIGTVGLTLGLTPNLGIVSHMILIVLMFFGRVGGLTVFIAAFSKRDTASSKYPVENIMVG